MKSVFVPLVMLSLLVSCATYRLQPSDEFGSEVKKERGQSLAVASKDGLVVEASARWAPEIEFNVKVTNNGGKSLTIDSDKFRLYSGDKGDWRELYVIPSDEYYARAEDEARARPVVTVTSTDAPVVRRRTTTTTTTVGGGRGSLTIIRTEQQPVVEPSTTRTVTIVSKAREKRLETLKETLFYSVTLEPKKDYTGLVFGEIGRGTYYKLVVPVDGKDYELVFERVKDKSNSPFTNLD